MYSLSVTLRGGGGGEGSLCIVCVTASTFGGIYPIFIIVFVNSPSILLEGCLLCQKTFEDVG